MTWSSRTCYAHAGLGDVAVVGDDRALERRCVNDTVAVRSASLKCPSYLTTLRIRGQLGVIPSTAELETWYWPRAHLVDAHWEDPMQRGRTMRRVAVPGSAGRGERALQHPAWYRTLVATCLLLGLLACAQIPVTELSGYRAAFDQAQTT